MLDSQTKIGHRLLAALLGLLVIGAPSFAADGNEDQGEIGFQVGARLADDVLVGSGNDEHLRLVYGLGGSYAWSDRLAWFIDANFSSHSSDLFGDADILTARTGIEARFEPNSKNTQWYVGIAPGWMDVDLGGPSTDFDRSMLSFSVGRRSIRDSGALRWELRTDSTLGDAGLSAERVTNFAVMLGWGWGVGGPPSDTDGDGVPDRRDNCPDTPAGATVDENGCPKDSDGDGVFDGIDKCADTPKGAVVDAAGCPKDSDGDGVYDGLDKCPETPEGATVDTTGCPKDSDDDGVYDGLDKCPETPEGVKVDASGCSKDSDGDGVADGIDKCPNTPKGATVDATGCPKDTDGDGVYDGLDKCPDTPKGTPVDETGCAKKLFEGETREFVLEGVNFEFNSAQLTASSTTILDRVAASLEAWPEVKVEVGGHTDSIGKAAYNQGLSEKRAGSVRDYLISKGIDSSRMTLRGYGESSPIADNGTEEGRAINRRVALSRLD